MDPIAVIKSVENTIEAYQTGDLAERAEILGKAAGDIAQLFVGGTAVKGVTKAKEVATVARGAEAAEEIAIRLDD